MQEAASTVELAQVVYTLLINRIWLPQTWQTGD